MRLKVTSGYAQQLHAHECVHLIAVQPNAPYVSLAGIILIITIILIKASFTDSFSSCIQIGMRVNMFISTATYLLTSHGQKFRYRATFCLPTLKISGVFWEISKGGTISKYETFLPFQLAGLSSGINVTECVLGSIYATTALWSVWVSLVTLLSACQSHSW